MKKFISILSLLLIAAISSIAQVPWVKDGSATYLKTQTDKVGIGTISPNEKLTIVSLSGESILGLKGYSTQSNAYIKLMNSNGTAIWGLYAKTDWWTIGNTIDSTTALLVAKINKAWIRINGTLSATKLTGTTITGVTGIFTGELTGAGITNTTTDTVTTAAVGTLCYRTADSTLYLKIMTTGPKSARWNKITKAKP
jgi:hypothetical protein